MQTARETPAPFTALLEEAYEVFACTAPAGLNVCTSCCMDPAEHAAMLASNPADIEDMHLVAWFNAAFVNEKFSPQIGCFLAPRLMAFAAGDNGYISHEQIFERVPIGDKGRWSDAQNAIIDRYHDTYLRWFATRSAPDPFLDDILCMFTLAGFPLDLTLDRLWDWSDEDLINRLWQDSQHAQGPTLWQSVWWDWGDRTGRNDITAAKAEVERWITGPKLRARLDAFMETADPESNIWSRAAEVEVALAKGF